MNFSPWIICSKKLVYLSLLISPHRKEMGEIVFWIFFHRDCRRCTMSYPRMVKTIILGMWTSPLNQHTLSLHTSNFCFSFETLYRINLQRLLVCFALIFIFWDHHTIFYIWEFYWKYGLKYIACFYCIGKRDV